VDGKQKRVYKAEWTRFDAEQALATALLQIEQRPKTKPAGMTFRQAADRYLAAKAKKLSLETDCLRLARLKAAFGAHTPLVEITAGRIAEYKIQRLRSRVRRDGEQHDI